MWENLDSKELNYDNRKYDDKLKSMDAFILFLTIMIITVPFFMYQWSNVLKKLSRGFDPKEAGRRIKLINEFGRNK